MLRSSQRGGLGGAGREKAAGERLTFNTTFLSLERAVRDGALVRRWPERPQFEDYKREFFFRPDLADLLNGGSSSHFPVLEWEKLIGAFCAGWTLSVSFKFTRKRADMERLASFDEVWALCPRKPRPGWRVLGRFVQPGCFVALAAWPKGELFGRYDEAAAEVTDRWRQIFGQQEPYRGRVAEEYLTGVCRNVDEFGK